MFGEKAIFGQSEVKIDIKGRIFLPTFTNKEENDELVLVYDDILKTHEIYSIKSLEAKFKQLEKLIEESKNIKEETYYKKRFYEFSKSILKSGKVDAHGRFLLGKIFEEEKLLCTGAFDRLLVEPLKKK